LEKAVKQASESEVVGEYVDGDDFAPDPTPRGGGKRLMGNASDSVDRNQDRDQDDEDSEYTYSYGDGRRGPSIGQILAVILALGLFAAAVFLIFSIVKPLLTTQPPLPTQSTSVNESVQPSDAVPSESMALAESAPPEESAVSSADPAWTDEPVVSDPPAVSPAPNEATVLPTSFQLSSEDFTFNAPGQSYRVAVTFQPLGSFATVTWTSSNPNVATVSADGRVTAVSKGTVTVTASVEGLGQRTCIVRCALNTTTVPSTQTGQTQTGQETPGTAQSSLKLNRADFTLSRKGETFQMRVTGTNEQATWASSNGNVATVSSNGTVTAVGRGNCTITATVGGQTLKCIVRCSF